MTEPVAYLYTSPSGAQELWFTPLSAREHAQGWTAVPLYAAGGLPVRRCHAMLGEPGMEPDTPCNGVSHPDGSITGGCSEPCSFVMHWGDASYEDGLKAAADLCEALLKTTFSEGGAFNAVACCAAAIRGASFFPGQEKYQRHLAASMRPANKGDDRS